MTLASRRLPSELQVGATVNGKLRAKSQKLTDERSESRSKVYFDYTERGGGKAYAVGLTAKILNSDAKVTLSPDANGDK